MLTRSFIVYTVVEKISSGYNRKEKISSANFSAYAFGKADAQKSSLKKIAQRLFYNLLMKIEEKACIPLVY
jgi:hypothetical protein